MLKGILSHALKQEEEEWRHTHTPGLKRGVEEGSVPGGVGDKRCATLGKFLESLKQEKKTYMPGKLPLKLISDRS